MTSLYIDRVPHMDCYMPKMVKKGDLPSKVCAACQKPFAWRKKWQRDWARVDTANQLAGLMIEHCGATGVAFAWEQQLLNTPVPAE